MTKPISATKVPANNVMGKLVQVTIRGYFLLSLSEISLPAQTKILHHLK